MGDLEFTNGRQVTLSADTTPEMPDIFQKAAYDIHQASVDSIYNNLSKTGLLNSEHLIAIYVVLFYF